jgi:hypothetical protein
MVLWVEVGYSLPSHRNLKVAVAVVVLYSPFGVNVMVTLGPGFWLWASSSFHVPLHALGAASQGRAVPDISKMHA